MSTARVVVISPHLREYAGRELERGEVFTMNNQMNDLKLMGWHYVRELEPGEETYKCTACGHEFLGTVTDSYTKAHLAAWRHDTSPVDLDGPQIKRGGKRRRTGTPDGDGEWDLERGNVVRQPTPDDFVVGDKNAPTRVALG